MPSFDIVCELNMAEVDNALLQTSKEIQQRYDFRGTESSVERKEKEIFIESTDEYKVKAVYDVLQSKFVKRGLSLKSIDPGKIEPAARGRAKQVLKLQEGIDKEKAKDLVKKVKDMKLKVQASIQEEQVRITGKKKDELQEVIAAIQALDYPLPLQFTNFRD